MIPVGHQVFHPGDAGEDIGHTDGERHRTTRASSQRFLHFGFQHRQVLNLHAEFGKLGCRRIDGKVVGRHKHTGSHQSHHSHETFGKHGTVTHEEHVLFISDHLRGRTRQGTAGNRNEDERDHRTTHDRAAAMDEFGNGRHLELGHHEDDAKSQSKDRTNLEERRQVVARQEQQPHRKNRCKEAVDRDQDRHRLAIDVKEAEILRVRSDPRTGKDAQEKQHHAQKRCTEHVTLAPDLQIQAHDDGDRNRCHNRVGRPQRIVHGVDTSNRKPRQRQDQNRKHSPGSHKPRGGIDFARGNVCKRTALVAHRAKQHDHIVHAARKNAADQNPQQTGQIAELGGQYGTE